MHPRLYPPKANMSSSTTFYSLSEELLTAIAQELVPVDRYVHRRDCHRCKCTLTDTVSRSVFKVLRLVHPRFAYLNFVRKVLFARIQLVATAEHLENLERANISQIAPLVKKVTFDGYHDDALVAKNLLQGQNLRVAWTKALRTLPRDPQLQFVTSGHKGSSYSVRPHYHEVGHGDKTCESAVAPIGDALFAAAIACLADAGVKARTLNVRCAMTSHFQWEALPGWETCDFSRVRSFKFQPRVQEECFFGQRDTLITERAADAAAAVLKKCKDSLEVFHYANDCPTLWPGHEVIALPKLKHLSLGDGYIRPRNLSIWMAGMSSLEHFECVSTKSCGDGNGTWLDVFDAIRNHPRGMKVYFDQICANDEEISMDYHTGAFLKYFESKPEAEGWSDVAISLPLYLSGKIKMDEATLEAAEAGELFVWV